MRIKYYLRLARFDHWIKNGFMIPGVAVACLLLKPQINEYRQVLNIVLAFCATCFISSANYIINEWLDAEFDQFHPVKKNRPVVTENLKPHFIILEYVVFMVVGLILSNTINLYFFLTELSLLLMGILYNVKPFRTKDIVYLDVLSESVNNIIRFLLGWFVITEAYFPPVSILFGYWMAGAFLMVTKRFAEYRMIQDSVLAGKYRKSFRYYTEKKLLCSSFFYAMCATFFIGVFMIKYRIEYVFSVPGLFLLFTYYLIIAFNDDSAVQKPESLFREKKLMGIAAVFVLLVVALSIVDIPVLNFFHEPFLLKLRP